MLWWKDDLIVDPKSVSHFHIDVVIEDKVKGSWRFIGFNGEPNTQLRHIGWDVFRRLNNNDGTPQLMMDDFNKVLLAA